jgi:predicted TIM-barrel fold metal-dependent hydrolase
MSGLVDCDVHCSAPSAAALRPYFSDYWQEYLDLTGFSSPRSLNLVYPRWLPMLSDRGANAVERVQDEVLGPEDRAILTCYQGVEAISHPDFAIALASALNSWQLAEWLERDERLLGSASVAPEFADAAVEEIERVAEAGRFAQVTVPVRGTQGYGHRRYWPIWEAAARHGLVLSITFGGVTGAPPTSANWLGNYYEDYVSATLAYQTQILSLIMQGTFARIPDLHVTIAESGWTWAPAFMWRMDQWWKSLYREVPWVTEPPSAYVRRHFRFTTQPCDAPSGSRQLLHAYEQLGGAPMLLYSSDFPHRYRSSAADILAAFPETDRDAIGRANAVGWYGLGKTALVGSPG